MPIKHDFSFFLLSLLLLLHLHNNNNINNAYQLPYNNGFCVIYVLYVVVVEFPMSFIVFSSLDGYLFAIHSTIIYYYVLSTTHEWCSIHWAFPSLVRYFLQKKLFCWTMPFKRDILICLDVQDRPVFIWRVLFCKGFIIRWLIVWNILELIV